MPAQRAASSVRVRLMTKTSFVSLNSVQKLKSPLGIHSREAGAVAFVFRYQDFCQCFGFTDALGLGMEVVIVLIEVTAIGVYFVGHGQDIFDARDFEIGNGCADGV